MFPECCPHVAGIAVRIASESAYKEQLREAGFTDHGIVGPIASMWTLALADDKITLWVELRYIPDKFVELGYVEETEEGFAICMNITDWPS